MKKIFYIFSCILVFLGACKEETGIDRGGSGWLSVEFLTDKALQTRADEQVYALEIQKTDGSLVGRYEDCATISDRILLPAGTYKLVASSGNDVIAGFEQPYYKGEQQVDIEAAITKEVAIICTQANIKISVEYSDLIKSNFPEYSLEVTNGEGRLAFAKDEKRNGYLRVSENTLVWNLTLHNGQEVFRLNKTITGVQPRQHYHFSFDIKENASEDEGAFVGGVVVDTATDVYNWLCDIVLKENIAKPEIRRLDGLAMSDAILVLEKARGADVQLDITAQARIQNLKLRHKSPVLKGLGIPENLVITELSQDVKDIVNVAGIQWGNEEVLNSQQVTLNFDDLVNNKLPLGDYEFFVSVYDARSRLVEDTLRISVIPDIDHIADEASVMDIWAKFATIRGRWYTLNKPEGMALEYSTDQNTWTRAGDMRFDETNKTFSASLTALQPNTTYYFRTTATEKGASATVRSFTTEGAEQIPYMNFDRWYMSGKSPMVGESGATQYWDSGNPGGAGFGIIPTTEETSFVVNGSAVKLASMGYSLLGAKVKFAAGNIYTGKFIGLDGTDAKIDFGIPYACRPTALRGMYKYRPGVVNWGNKGNMSGKTDSCHIYIILTDWTDAFHANSKSQTFVDLSESNKSIIALGELKTDQATAGEGYVPLDIPLKYRDKNRKPSYILIVATASKYGDYFTGSDSSVLWLDEFELGFDPVE